MYNPQVQSLIDARATLRAFPSLEDIAKQPNVIAFDKRPLITFDEVIALYQSAKTNREDAKLFAVFLQDQLSNPYQTIKMDTFILDASVNGKLGDAQLLQMIKANLQQSYLDHLKFIVEKSNNQDKAAIFLLGVEEANAPRKNWGAELGKGRLKSLLNDPEYGPLVRAKFPDMAPQIQSLPEERVFKKAKPAGQLAEEVGKSDAKQFIELVQNIIDQARQSKVEAKLFKKVDEAIRNNSDAKGINYVAVIDELVHQRTKQSVIKKVKSISPLSEQTTPQSKTIVHAINQYGEGNIKEALKVLTEFQKYKLVPKPLAKEQVKPIQNLQVK